MKRIIYLMTAMLALVSCNDIELCDLNHQYHSQITFVAKWDHCTSGVTTPSEHIIEFGSHIINATSASYVMDAQPFEAGNYSIKAYNPCSHVTFTGDVASVAVSNGYAEVLPDWLWTYNCSHDLVKDTHAVVELPMRQQMRQLNFIVRFEGGTAGVVSGVSGDVTGVASKLNVATDVHSDAVKISPAFTRDGEEYKALSRMFGFVDANNKLMLTLALPGGNETVECDLSSYTIDFNDNKIVPVNATILVRNLIAGQIEAEVVEWEEVDLDGQGSQPVVPTNQMQLLWDGCDPDRISFIEIVDGTGASFASKMEIVNDGSGDKLKTTQLYSIPATASKVYLNIAGENSATFNKVEIPAKYITTDISGGVLTLNGLYLVFTPAEMDAVRNRLDKDFWQMNDLDLSGYANWLPIGRSADGTTIDPFTGTFLGRGNKIKNLTINYPNVDENRIGLFGRIGDPSGNALIDGVHIESGSVAGYRWVGAIVGDVRDLATITNCSNKATVSGRSYLGGIVGAIGSASSGAEIAAAAVIENCYNHAGITGVISNVGGILGSSYGNSVVRNCHNTGDIVSGSGWSAGVAGAILGLTVSPGTQPRGLITGCTNTGTVTAGGQYGVAGISGVSELTTIEHSVNKGDVFGFSNLGGIVGQFSDDIIRFCRNEGNIKYRDELSYTDKGVNVGGIVGLSFGLESIEDCMNTGDIDGGRAIGGIIGSLGEGKVLRSCNTGTLSGTRHNIGGVIGHAGLDATSPVLVADCYNTGELKSVTSLSGIASEVRENAVVRSCYSVGEIAATGNSAGICSSNKGTIVSCYFTDTVNPSRAGIFSDTGSSDVYRFSLTAWPEADPVEQNWLPAAWKSLGTKSEVNPIYPKLSWE